MHSVANAMFEMDEKTEASEGAECIDCLPDVVQLTGIGLCFEAVALRRREVHVLGRMQEAGLLYPRIDAPEDNSRAPVPMRASGAEGEQHESGLSVGLRALGLPV